MDRRRTIANARFTQGIPFLYTQFYKWVLNQYKTANLETTSKRSSNWVFEHRLTVQTRVAVFSTES